jgi:NAD(P)-dependent dehydrogenase (short-subunit alcohol dehydrogenase family)
VVVITGSSSGIGRAVAERLAPEGACVVVDSWRSVEEGGAVARSLPEALVRARHVSREDDARPLMAAEVDRSDASTSSSSTQARRGASRSRTSRAQMTACGGGSSM